MKTVSYQNRITSHSVLENRNQGLLKKDQADLVRI